MKHKFIIVLDNIRSMHNVGSMFRTADAAGVEKMYLCGITPGPLDRWNKPNEKFLKVSLGAEQSVTWERAESTFEVLQNLKKEGYEILAIEINKNAVSVFDYAISKKKKYALVLGSETTGLSSEILNLAHAIVKIPMFGQKESLNVSVAFGIVIFQLLARTNAVSKGILQP